jgi:arylsulfatase A-like enzyme
LTRPDKGCQNILTAPSPSGKAEVCKTSIPGSNPGGASNLFNNLPTLDRRAERDVNRDVNHVCHVHGNVALHVRPERPYDSVQIMGGRRLSVVIGTVVVIVAVTVAAAASQRRPNVVLIVADDLGYADLSAYGSTDIPTPNIDAIGAAGVRFTDGYVSGPYCSPTRAGLMTGRYPQRFGYEFQPEGAFSTDGSTEFGLPATELTLAERLKAAGYRTALFGKWHLGSAAQFHPLRRGFEEFFGFLGGQHSYMQVAVNDGEPLLDGFERAASVSYLTDMLADRSVAFIDRHASEPFFLYLAFNAGHTPLQAPERYLQRFQGIADMRRRTYAAMVSAMDDAVGRTIAALRKNGLEKDTLVVFLNDNGGPTMPGTTVNASNNGALRGSKRQTWEGGVRVAFAMSWPGQIPAGQVDGRPVIQLDVVPTALAAAKVNARGERFDGVDLLPFLTNRVQGQPHDALYWRFGGMMAIRKGDWKLVKTREGPLVDVDPSVLSDLSGAGLYNLREDIGESRDLAGVQRDRAKELGRVWQRWNRQLLKPRWAPRPGFGGG